LISRAAEKGITILNEVGLDPGIDHLLAMECFDEVHQAGGKVESFISFCGGKCDCYMYYHFFIS
jgi:alpha-aminoadipic semialdehyde synthase